MCVLWDAVWDLNIDWRTEIKCILTRKHVSVRIAQKYLREPTAGGALLNDTNESRF
jgi:hypothetical protein